MIWTKCWGTKLRAPLQSEHGCDLFDLWWAWEVSKGSNSSVKVVPARVGAAFFASTWTRKAVGSTQTMSEARMTSSKFFSDIVGFLPAGREYSPQRAQEARSRREVPACLLRLKGTCRFRLP